MRSWFPLPIPPPNEDFAEEFPRIFGMDGMETPCFNQASWNRGERVE
ncbi:hypothetical protein [Azospirillum doebereinerae]